MATGSGTPPFDLAGFVQNLSMQCVRTTNASAVARTLGLPHFEPARLPEDLADIDPRELPCLVVSAGGWTYVLGHSRGLRGGSALSSEFGECVSLHIDTASGTTRCERARRGRVERQVYASTRDQECLSEGDPAAGEPLLDPGALTADDVLACASAWGTDPLVVARGTVSRAFLASRKPATDQTLAKPQTTVWATVFSVLALLGGSVGAGAALWWMSQSSQRTATTICEHQALCSGCVGCAASAPHPCAAAFATCEADVGCFALTACLTDCLGLGARTGFTAPSDESTSCFAACRGAHPEGLAAYCAWTSCAHRGACADRCTAPGYLELAACQ